MCIVHTAHTPRFPVSNTYPLATYVLYMHMYAEHSYQNLYMFFYLFIARAHQARCASLPARRV